MPLPPPQAGSRKAGWPLGASAWHQYHVRLAGGHKATLAFSLADPGHATTLRVKEIHCASHVGLFLVRGDPDSREEVVLWFQQATSLTLFSQNALLISHEVRGLLPRYFAVFFDDIKELVPELAAVRLIAPRTRDKTLN